jgi:hypothetical protein
LEVRQRPSGRSRQAPAPCLARDGSKSSPVHGVISTRARPLGRQPAPFREPTQWHRPTEPGTDGREINDFTKVKLDELQALALRILDEIEALRER